MVDRYCQGKEECVFQASSTFLGQPCCGLDNGNYIDVEYHCTDTTEPEAEVFHFLVVYNIYICLHDFVM